MKVIRSVLALSVALLASIVSADAVVGKNDADLIASLPNFNGTIPFKQYAGRLELEAKEKLFYWYTESQNKPTEDPIVLWLNGGPGCSSMGGFWTENGPFVVRPDETVKVNRYAWNRNVNLVWLEQPAGVGFSGPIQNASYYNDENVAEKAYEFVKLFFAKYTELQGRQFYITGESYAGIYIPFLVDLLVKNPIKGVNLTGYAIGNPFTDTTVDGNAYIDYYWSHGMLSLENYDAINTECGDKVGACMNDPTNCTQTCQDVQDYEGLTFKTVKGAGHMVPAVKPLHGLYMFECFVLGDAACAKLSYPVDEEEFQAGAFLDIDLHRVPAPTTSTTSSFSTGSAVLLVAVGSAVVALVAVGYKNTQKRARYQTISSRV